MYSRRDFLRLAAAGPLATRIPGFAATADFWNHKAPSDWTPAEIEELLTQSPWAKVAAVSFTGGMGGAAAPRMTRGGVVRNGTVRGGRAVQPDAPTTGDIRQNFRAVVRWDSALPIRDALKLRASNATEKFYVLAVTGDLPMLGRREDDDPAASERTVEMLRQYTKLERKGDPLFLEDAQATPANYPGGPATLFYFPRGDSFLPGDKQTTFSTKFGPYEVKAHFAIKEMMYHGKLEL